MPKPQHSLVLALGVSVATIAGALTFLRPHANVDELFRQAVSVAQGEDPESAILLFDEVLSHDPSHVKALLYRGQLTAQQGDPDTAISFFSRIGDAPRREAGTARYLEATAWYTKRNAAMAERQFLAAIALHPTFLKARESLVQLYYIQSRPVELQRQLAAIRNVREWNLEELFASQLAWFASSQPQENIPILEGFVAANPNDVVSSIALARHYLTHDRSMEAIELLRRDELHARGDLTVHGLLSECHSELLDFKAAWQQIEDDTSAMDNPTVWWRAVGRCAAQAELWPEAVSALTIAVARNSNDYEAAYMLGIAAQRCGQKKFSEQQLEMSRVTEKLSTAAVILLKTNRERQDLLAASILDVGRLLLELRRPREASPWLSTSLNMRPNHPEALTLWNLANTQIGDSPQQLPTVVDPAIVDKIAAAIKAQTPLESQPGRATDLAAIRLRDIHTEVGLEFQYFNGESTANYILQTVGAGVAAFDFDGDDWPDLFFPNGRELEESSGQSSTVSDRLYRNRGGVKVEDVTQLSGVSSDEFGQGCVACDFNNDGFQDIVVGTFGRLLAYRNQGDGTFVEVAQHAGLTGSRWTSSLAMSDLDRDGDLDLYVTNYLKDPFVACRDNDGRPVVCSPANFEAEQDLLFVSDGDGAFRDATQSTGLQAPNGKGLGVVIADFNNDGWQDIYVANDGEQNVLFQNQTQSSGGRLSFSESGLVSGAAVSADGRAQAGMGIACDDFDHDGWLDLYVTNFFQDYNTFYLNRQDLTFVDHTSALRLVNPTMKTLGFGTQSVDLDLDGYGEILVANGHIHDRRFEGTPWQMPPHCFQRMPDGTYQDISNEIGPYFRGEYIGRAVARLDFNHDYLPDAVVVHQDRPVALLVNETQNTGRALVLKLRGIQSNRDAIGTRIEFRIGGADRLIELTGGDGYCSSNERTMIVGVGTVTSVPEVIVRWPSGHMDKLVEVPTNVSLVLIESRAPIALPTVLELL